jgi:hypothetical protein
MILIIVIAVYCVYFTEGFKKDEAIPDYCGSAGYTMHPELKKNLLGKDSIPNRQYTESECDKIDGAKLKNGLCTLTKNGKEINCNDTCKGLNKIKSLPPNECSVDGKLLGITNKQFTLKLGKKVIVPENTVRLYTSKECEELNGKHDISILTMMNDKEKEQFIEDHGTGYGNCKGEYGTDYSTMCYADPPSMTDVKNKLSGLLS